VKVPSTMEYQGAHTNVSIDNSLISGPAASLSFKFNLATTMDRRSNSSGETFNRKRPP